MQSYSRCSSKQRNAVASSKQSNTAKVENEYFDASLEKVDEDHAHNTLESYWQKTKESRTARHSRKNVSIF